MDQSQLPPGQLCLAAGWRPIPYFGKKQTFCKKVKFWEKDIWPPSNPDLNLLDFFWWSAIERKSNATLHPNINLLKAAIVKEWADYPSKGIVDACASFRRRVEAIIKNNGSHID